MYFTNIRTLSKILYTVIKTYINVYHTSKPCQLASCCILNKRVIHHARGHS